MRGLPTWKQFRNWSLPSKYTFVGFVVGSLLSGVSVYLSVRPNPQLVMLEKVLRAERPTKLTVNSVDTGHHLGTERELVFAQIKNSSNMPAYQVHIKLRTSTSTIGNPTDPALKMYYTDTLTIPAGNSLRLPIAYKAAILAAVNARCVTVFSLNPNIHDQSATAVPMLLEYGYTTIFDEPVISKTGVWAIVPASCG